VVVKPRCVGGCGQRAVQLHHVVYRQELRRICREDERRSGSGMRYRPLRLSEVRADERNLVPVCAACHERHHRRGVPLRLHMLPDSVFEFAVELMGAGAAFEYLRRRYAGRDPRLDALLEAEAA
jgi:hypothetical protein